MNFIYIFCTLITKTATKIFFKKINIIGLENISDKKPLFIYGNHNNAFFDSMVVHFALNENIYTLTRGDVFSSKLKNYLLSQFHILPIYRMQEGIENLHKNADTFSTTTTLLKQNKKVIIFPEGNCIQEKNLRKFKKGMARMAYSTEAETNFTLGLQLQPIAINYTKPSQFRSSYEIIIGKSIEVKKFETDYLKNPNAAINKMNDECEKKLSELVVIVKDKENERLHDLLCEIYSNNSHTKSRKFIADLVNNFEPNTLNQIKQTSDKYSKLLYKYGIRDWVVMENENGFGKISFYTLILILTSPLYLIGLLLNYIAFKTPYLIAKKMCKNIEFFTSINLVSGAFIWVISFILYVILLSVITTNGFIFMLSVLMMPLGGLFALWYWEKAKKIIGKFRWLKLTRNNKDIANEIIEMRNEMYQISNV
jgi:1-acyl-sn-glycerol-3-phosphate acyltransferase